MTTTLWIIEYCATFIESLMCTIFCGTFIENTDLKRNRIKRFIVAAVSAILIIIMNHIDLYSPISVAFTIIIMLSIVLSLYYKSPVKAIVLGFVYTLILAGIDNTIISGISYGLKIPLSQLYNELSIYRVFVIISSKTFLMLFIIMLNKFFGSQRTLRRIYLIILFFVATVILVLNFIITFRDIKNNIVPSLTSIVLFATMLSLILIIFLGTFKMAEYYDNQQQLKLVQLKNSMLEQSIAETEQTFELWRDSMHDYKHNMISLMTLAEKDDISGIKEYLKRENELLGKKLFYYKTGNDAVDTILYIKKHTAENNDIPFVINANIPEDCPVSSAHFASLLGNLLDNAIEASAFEKEPYIELKIKPVKSYLAIIVTNKCTKSNSELKTRKPDKQHHGIGINSIRHTVKQYNGHLAIEHENGIFTSSIMIPL